MQACLSTSEDRVSSFLLCGGVVKLVKTRLCVGSTQQRRFHRRGGAVKHMQACLSARTDGESSFLHSC